jgi:hypothetical protein
MTTQIKRALTVGFGVMTILVACCLVLHAAVPRGWYLEGTKPADYEVAVGAEAEYGNYRSVVLRAKMPVVKGFGTLMQQFRADNYLGKRVRLSGSLKTDGLQDWAGLWMRVNKGNLVIAFDNMQGRVLKGTHDWKDYEVVLDVPRDATDISFGVLLQGSGSVWLRHPQLETVGYSVPTTGSVNFPQQMRQTSNFPFPEGPLNLNFEN